MNFISAINHQIAEDWFAKISGETDFELYCFLSGPCCWLVSLLINSDRIYGWSDTDLLRDLKATASGAPEPPIGNALESMPTDRVVEYLYQIAVAVHYSDSDCRLYLRPKGQLVEINHHAQIIVQVPASRLSLFSSVKQNLMLYPYIVQHVSEVGTQEV